MTDYRGLLETLAKGGVDFILVGGLAATVHGSARLTHDVEVVYSRAPRNPARLVAALGPIQPYLRGAPPDLPFRWDNETLAKGLDFTLSTKLGDLDLFGEIAGGGTFEELADHAVKVQLFGVDIRCLDLPTLIRVKRAAGRPQDLEIVAELEALLEEEE